MEPLANVLDFYGGNTDKMRRAEDFEKDNKNGDDLDFRVELAKLNKHVVNGMVKTPKPYKREKP